MADESDMDENDKNVGFLYKAMRNRAPGKRRVKPVSKHLIQVNFGEDDSDNDSDYQAKNSDLSDDDEQELETDDQESDHGDASNKKRDNSDNESAGSSKCEITDDDLSIDSSDDSSDDEGSDDDESDGRQPRNLFDVMNTDDDEDDEDYIPRKKQKHMKKHVEKQRIRSPDQVPSDVQEESQCSRPMKVLICCVCLGDISETDDEIVECDNCGVAVHEGCYGISDTQSAASTESSASTEPWFCDACKAGVKPDCELCPNEGGIFKETDAGKWVHLVCALYTPGVAFGDVDKLSPVTLFEMPYSKWGLKECSLCEDSRFCKTGVCVSCDAGMCRSFFHVTCAQRNGLLSEASPDEANDIADPFYAYCKLHADKNTSRAKRRNFLAIQSHVRQHLAQGISDEKERARFKRKMNKHRQNYLVAKAARPPSWVPPQKMVRYLTSSPSAVKKMLRKAELMGIITQSHHVVHTAEKQERKKSHTGPAFAADFVTYYLDRNVKIEKMKSDLKELEKQNLKLRKQDNALRHQYDKLLKQTEKPEDPTSKLRQEGEKLWSILNSLSGKPRPLPEIFRPKKLAKSPTRKEVLKSPSAVINQCGICRKSHDQHLLARCDKCRLWYHLGCLDPPLSRMPKKSSRWGWQCSECVHTSSDDSEESSCVDIDAPRRLREKIKEPAKFSKAKEDMEFLFPNMHGKRDRKRKKEKTGLKKKPVKKKELSQPREPERNKPKPEETSVSSPPTPAEVSRPPTPAEVSGPPTPAEVSRPLTPAEVSGPPTPAEVSGPPTPAEVSGPPTPAEISGPPTPAEIVISDDSSMEVEIKIVEETTPIHKQLTSFHDVSRKGRRIIKKKHYDEDEDDSDISPKQPAAGRKVTPEKDGGKKPSSKPVPDKPSQCVTCSETGGRKTMVQCDSCEQWYHFKCLSPPCTRTPKQRGYNWFCEACDLSDDSEDDDNGEEKT